MNCSVIPNFSNLAEYLPNLRYVTPAFKVKHAIAAALEGG